LFHLTFIFLFILSLSVSRNFFFIALLIGALFRKQTKVSERMSKNFLELFLILTLFVASSRAQWWDNWWGDHHHSKRKLTFSADCCVIKKNLLANYRGCNTKVYSNNTILFNPNYPQLYSGGSRCVYQVRS
jgi:hypothetical protein